MAPGRIVLLTALVLAGVCVAGSPGARADPAPIVVQYIPERPYYAPQPPHYGSPPPRRRQVCWTERGSVFVGYDRYGRPMYRAAPRRVCRWQYY